MARSKSILTTAVPMVARHSVHYRQLPHHFFEFDFRDKHGEVFLSQERRLALLEGSGIHTVPVLHVGALDREKLGALIGPSRFDSMFENPFTNRIDHRMEGLYLRTEAAHGVVTGRAKFVRIEFVEMVKPSEMACP
jgi:RNA ligase